MFLWILKQDSIYVKVSLVSSITWAGLFIFLNTTFNMTEFLINHCKFSFAEVSIMWRPRPHSIIWLNIKNVRIWTLTKNNIGRSNEASILCSHTATSKIRWTRRTWRYRTWKKSFIVTVNVRQLSAPESVAIYIYL